MEREVKISAKEYASLLMNEFLYKGLKTSILASIDGTNTNKASINLELFKKIMELSDEEFYEEIEQKIKEIEREVK